MLLNETNSFIAGPYVPIATNPDQTGTIHQYNFEKAICSGGIISLTFDFIAYTSCLAYVINSAWSTLDTSKVGAMSVLILGFPMIHFLLEAIVRYWLYKV